MNPTIVIDTREKSGKKDHIISKFDKYDVKHVRSKLYVGDYALLNNQSVVVDVKQGLHEVYSNLIQDHERFRTECIRAQEAGIRLIVLVEEPRVRTLDDVQTWVNPRDIIYRKQAEKGQATQKAAPVSSKRLMNIMRTMSELYQCEWSFTPKERCGETILMLLGVSLF